FPLESIHPYAFKASEAVECSREQGKFWEMHDRLFENRQALAEPDLLGYALELGLDRSKFSKCLGGAMASVVRADQAEATRLGVQSTPTLMIGEFGPNGRIKLMRRIAGAVPYTT